jgi:hypothetical protein
MGNLVHAPLSLFHQFTCRRSAFFHFLTLTVNIHVAASNHR